MASTWWPLSTVDRGYDDGCDICGRSNGLSRDDDGRKFCPDHRDRHGC